MTSSRSAVRKLDRVLSALENSLLSASDEDIVSSARDSSAVAEARAIIRPHLKDVGLESTSEVKHQPKKKVKSVPSGPRELASRLKLLQTLLRSRPELSPTISAVFSGGRKPSKRLVDQVTKELVRLGVLKDDKD